jgi:hypothetical protein
MAGGQCEARSAGLVFSIEPILRLTQRNGMGNVTHLKELPTTMSSLITKFALAAVAAGALFAAGSVATATQAEARHGFHGGFGGVRIGIGLGFGHRFGYRHFGHRFGYRPFGYRFGYARLWRPRVVVLPPSPCRIVYRTNVYGALYPVRVCRVVY